MQLYSILFFTLFHYYVLRRFLEKQENYIISKIRKRTTIKICIDTRKKETKTGANALAKSMNATDAKASSGIVTCSIAAEANASVAMIAAVKGMKNKKCNKSGCRIFTPDYFRSVFGLCGFVQICFRYLQSAIKYYYITSILEIQTHRCFII